MRRKTLLFCAAMAVLACTTSFAATFTVTNLNDSGAGSLRQAIVDANADTNADTIVFQAGLTGTIALTSDSLVIYTPIEILGPGADVIAVSGGDALLVLVIYPTGEAAISGLTITEGTQGLYNSGVLAMSQCTISSCGTASTSFGGGIYSYSNGGLTLEDCTLSSNAATERGGGIYMRGNTARATNTLTRCTFTNNFAGGGSLGVGGAIDTSVSNNTFDQCSFTDNTVAYQGGAIYDEGNADNTATQCSFTGNSTSGASFTGYGGAIQSFDGSTWTLSDCTFSDNQAVAGGAVYLEGTWSATNCTFSGNTATGSSIGQGGGAIWLKSLAYPTATFTHCTLSGNSAATGGGIFLDSGQLALANTLIASTSGGNFHNAAGAITSAGGNLDSDGTGGLTGTNDQSGTVANPIDPLLGALRDNGGPTFTHALLVGSPAIDAALLSNMVATDQRGVARPQDGDGDGVAVPDIGSYEHQPANLSINKTDSGKVRTRKGDTLTYTITVRNHGPGTSSNVVVTDTLPSGIGFIGATAAVNGVALPSSALVTPAPGTTGTVTANLGDMAISDIAVVTITVQVLVSKTTLVNSASVTSDIFDPNRANNAATVSTVIK